VKSNPASPHSLYVHVYSHHNFYLLLQVGSIPLQRPEGWHDLVNVPMPVDSKPVLQV
jgi:hypothetical protein